MEVKMKNQQYAVPRYQRTSSMKGLLVVAVSGLLLSGPVVAQSKDALVCNVADFKMLALATNDEQAREKSVSDWLAKFGKACAPDQITFIRGNLAPWLGTANTIKINQSIETLLAEKKTAQKNYEADTSELEKNKNNMPVNKPQADTVSTRR
jgi:predicted MPP superfamily phosphohydrolase